MTRRIAMAIPAMACMLGIAVPVFAQSTITGVVKDTSGAVLPGVNVEASSPALIEKSRTAITDGQGTYRIVDLRPGTYVVTFALGGFQTLRREGVELPSEFTATINAELKVGSLEESVTVTGASPVVDVTTAVHTQVISRDVLDAVPTGGTIQGVGQLVVGVNLSLPDVGGARGMQQTYMSTHGMSASNNTVMVDGMRVNGLQADGAVQSYFNDAMSQEVSYQSSGIGADTSSGGVRLNMIPREGGNRFSGDFKTAYRPGDWQADNTSDRLKRMGVLQGQAVERIIDFNFAQGGPIKRDRLWFFGSARYFSVNTQVPNTFFDDGSPGIDDQFIKSALLRMTWQVSPRNKLSAYFDEVDKFRGHEMQSLYDPETAAQLWGTPVYHTTAAKWTSTVTNRLLLEGGWSSNLEHYQRKYEPGISKPRYTPQWYSTVTRYDADLGNVKDAAFIYEEQSPTQYSVQTSGSYVTGSHNFRTGFQWTWGPFNHLVDANGDLYQVYRSNSTGIPWTVPSQVVVRNTPIRSTERLNGDIGVYAQDSWRLKRLTLNLGLRWESINAQVLAGESPAGRFVPARRFDELQDLPNWKNWAPRFAVVYDLFGNAKTALKYTLNRYNRPYWTSIAETYNPLTPTTSALAWTDLNGDDIAQGERGCVYRTAGCEIEFANLPANFGAVLNRYGGYPRLWNLEHGLEIQHELLPRVSVTASWFHGGFRDYSKTVNQLLTAADYTPIQIFDPRDGSPITIYNLNANKANAVDNLATLDPTHRNYYDSINLEFRARPGRAQVFGGIAFEHDIESNCYAPDNPNSLRFCDQRDNNLPYQSNYKASGVYPLPWDVTLSGSFQSTQAGTEETTFYTLTRTLRYPSSCPAPCPAGALVVGPQLTRSTLNVTLNPSGTEFGDRINQLDIKVTRTFRRGRVNISPALELFNVLNPDNIVSVVTNNYASTSYKRPNSIVQGRLIGIGARIGW
jgi:Carboxypeptidase regulatory-like domain